MSIREVVQNALEAETGERQEAAFFNTREDLLYAEAERRYVGDEAVHAFVAGAQYILTGK